MTEDLTLKGFWWTPDAPDRRCFGVLSQTEKAIELVCHSDHGEQGVLKDIPAGTVYGKDEKGRPVTLLVTSRVGSTRSGGLETTRLHTGYVLVGVHVTDKDAIRIQSVVLNIQHLYGWLGATGFNRQLSGSLDADGVHLKIPYDSPDKIQHIVREGLTVAFGVDANYSVTIQAQSIHEESYVCVTHKDGFTFNQAWKMATVFRSFLHFAALKPVYVVSMRFLCHMECVCDIATASQEIAVWSCSFHDAETLPQWDTRWTFRYQDVSGRFPECFDEWLNYNERYGEALACYMSTIYHKLPATVTCLCLTQALDAYHGVRFESHKDQDFKKKISCLLETSDVVMSGLVSDITVFAEQVHATRNYYTHHNPKWLSEGKVAQGHDLMRMNEKLRILLQSFVIRDMGLPVERCAVLRHQIASEIVMY